MEDELSVGEVFSRRREIRGWQIEKCVLDSSFKYTCTNFAKFYRALVKFDEDGTIERTDKVWITRSIFDTFQIPLSKHFPDLDADNYMTLYPHQMDALKWMIHQENHPPLFSGVPVSGGILADAMGLGKTKTLIALLTVQPKARTLLVLPKAVQYQWIRELIAQGHKVFFIHPNSAMRCRITPEGRIDIPSYKKGIPHTALPDFFVGITSPTLIHADPEPSHDLEVGTPFTTNIDKLTPFRHIIWDRIVFDEAHTLRNGVRLKGEKGFGAPKTLKYFRAHRLLTKPGAPRWGLTGTPLQNRLSDIVSLMMWIGIPINTTTTTSEDILDYIRAKMFRRSGNNLHEITKRAIHFPDIPFEDNHVLVTYKTELERNFYVQAAGAIAERLEAVEMSHYSGIKSDDSVLMLINTLRFLSAHPQMYIDSWNKRYGENLPPWTESVSKLEMILDKLHELYDEDENCVIFNHFDEEARQLDNCARYAGYTNVFIMNGSITPEERDWVIQHSKQLTKADEKFVIIASIMSCGEGLNMQHIRNAIISTPDWNPANENQAIGRINRIGQTRQVRVWRYYLNEVHNASLNIDSFMKQKKDEKSALEEQYVSRTPNAAWFWPAMELPGHPGVPSTFFEAPVEPVPIPRAAGPRRPVRAARAVQAVVPAPPPPAPVVPLPPPPLPIARARALPPAPVARPQLPPPPGGDRPLPRRR